MRTNEEIIAFIQGSIEDKGISMSELARKVGIAKSTMSRYFNKTREFPLNRADEFAKVLNVTPEFLLGIEKHTEVNQSKIISIYNKLEEDRQEKVIDFATQQLAEQESYRISESIFEKTDIEEEYITDFAKGVVAAGHGAFQEDELYMEVRLLASKVPEKYDTIATVVGDSMEPLIRNNDLLFIEVTSQVEVNSIGIFKVNGKNFVKKLKRDYDGRWYLQSLNNSYEEIYLSEDDDIRTIGEVVDIYRER